MEASADVVEVDSGVGEDPTEDSEDMVIMAEVEDNVGEGAEGLRLPRHDHEESGGILYIKGIATRAERSGVILANNIADC